MTILHLSKTATGGRFIGFQLPHLVSQNLDVHLALPGEGILAEMARTAGATVHVMPSLGSTPLSAARAIAAALTAIRPEILHSHFAQTTMAARLGRQMAGVSTPIFFQVPGPLHLERRWSRTLDTTTAGSQDHWGPACHWSYDRYLRSGVPANRVHLSYYGKELSDYTLDSDRRDETREALGIAPAEVLVIMVSHVYPPRRGRRRGVKGHEDFILAMASAQHANARVRGIIVGGPRPGAEEYFRRLQRGARTSGATIDFLGARDDVTRLYEAADIAVHPSLSENLGGAGESLLMEVPTITTNVGGFPDIVRPGVSGLMVPPRQPEALSKAIIASIRNMDQMKRMARIGRSFVELVGDAQTNATKVANVYQEML